MFWSDSIITGDLRRGYDVKSVMHQELLIDGHMIGGACDQSVGKEIVRNPWTGEIVGTVAEGAWSELSTAIASAQDAQPKWAATPVAERAELLRRVASLVRERKEELAELLVREIGKPITLALAEVERLAVTFDLSASESEKLVSEPWDLGPDKRAGKYSADVFREPLGVIFAITPYNWPFNLAAHKIAPALAAGNTVVLKPSPLGALSSLTLARLIHEAGAPPGVINSWNGPTIWVTKALQDPRIAMLSFTGSAAVGWDIKTKLPRKPVTLELGGDGFVIVDKSADIDRAAEKVVFGGYAYAGQICISVQHVLVQEAIYEQFKSALTAAVGALQVGDPSDPSTILGPMISESAAVKVEEWIQEAIQMGAHPLVLGAREKTRLGPTLLEDVPFESKLGHEEVFGPVLTLEKFSSISDAIKRVNRSEYGIQAGIFSEDSESIAAAISGLQVGGVVVNDVPTTRFDALPYGGVKQSGFGREGVRFAIEEMTRPKAVLCANLHP